MGFPKFLKVAVLTTYIKENINGTIVQKITSDVADSHITHILSQGLGFSYKLVHPPDGQTGHLLPNGTWTGIMGMLLRGEADIAVTKMALLDERLRTLPFTKPYVSSEITFITRKPEYTPSITAFLHPFSLYVWMSLILCVGMMPFIFRILLSRRHGISKLFLLSYSTFFGQGFAIDPKKISEYLTIGFWLMSVMILSYCYTALLLSFITFPPLTGVRTIPELAAAVEKGKYISVSYPGGNAAFVLSKSPDPNARIIGKNIGSNLGTRDIQGALRKSKNSTKVAFVRSMLSFLALKESYFISDDVFLRALFGIPQRKGFCCIQYLNEIIDYMHAAGLIDKIYSDDAFRSSLYSHLYSSDDDEETERPLSLLDFEGAFVFLVGGHAAAIIVFITEIIVGRCNAVFKKYDRKYHRRRRIGHCNLS